MDPTLSFEDGTGLSAHSFEDSFADHNLRFSGSQIAPNAEIDLMEDQPRYQPAPDIHNSYEQHHFFKNDIAANQAHDESLLIDMDRLSEVDTPVNEDEMSEMTVDSEAPLTQTWSKAFESLVPVHNAIPPAYPDRRLDMETDHYVEEFMSRFNELEAKAAQATSTKEMAELYEPYRALWDAWQYLWSNHHISAIPSLDRFVHIARVYAPVRLSQAGFALNSLPSTKTKMKPYDKPAILHIIREPSPIAVNAATKIGPIQFELVLRPGLTMTRDVACQVTIANSNYAYWADVEEDNGDDGPATGGRGAASKERILQVDHGNLTRLENGAYQLDWVSFTSTSNGRVFDLNFNFTIYEGTQNYTVSARSLPILCVSNIGSQWDTGEGRYVAALAFGLCNTTKNSTPQNEVRYPSLQNAVQFAHVTCTRQIGSLYYILKLKQENDAAVRHFERKRTKENSGRSSQAQKAKALYNSFASYSRVQRNLSEEEIRSIFPPTSSMPAGAFAKPKSKSGNEAWLPDPDGLLPNGQLEVVTYESFCKRWKWWGTFMYKLYTGQVEGVEVRTLWLAGLIHLVSSDNASGLALLDLKYGVGAALIRTSRTPGRLTYAFIRENSGDVARDFSYKPVAVAKNNDYSSTLQQETFISRFVNISGIPIEKTVVVSAFGKPEVVLPLARLDGIGYHPSLTPSFENLQIQIRPETSEHTL